MRHLVESGPPQRMVSALAEATLLLGYVAASPAPARSFGGDGGGGPSPPPPRSSAWWSSFSGGGPPPPPRFNVARFAAATAAAAAVGHGVHGATSAPAPAPAPAVPAASPAPVPAGPTSGAAAVHEQRDDGGDFALAPEMSRAARSAALADLPGALAAVEQWAEQGILAYLTGRTPRREAAEDCGAVVGLQQLLNP
jgi:hypothetical protein